MICGQLADLKKRLIKEVVLYRKKDGFFCIAFLFSIIRIQTLGLGGHFYTKLSSSFKI